ncbi:MAG: hypothetical protein Q7J07_06285 [Pelolinea sp.]|nr:hypothetical protein [Pelolinea sp.]
MPAILKREVDECLGPFSSGTRFQNLCYFTLLQDIRKPVTAQHEGVINFKR